MKGRTVTAALIIIAIFFIAFLFGAPGTGKTTDFDIQPGENVSDIGMHLKKQGLIKSSFIFKTYLSAIGAQTKVQAGRYRLSSDHTLFSLVDILLSGNDRSSRRVTLIEGWSLREYQEYLAKNGFDGARFGELTAQASAWKSEYPFLSSAPQNATLEGYLFPDTYQAGSDKDTRALIIKMLDNFDAKAGAIRAAGGSLHEIVTLGSIIEQEVSGGEDRRLVADIFLKRLNIGIALQSDATINYITGSGRTRATVEDLAIDSPYNTYRYPGLPPGPIGNPGLDALTAAVSPKKNDYLYFLTDRDGKVYYAKTFEDHKRNKERYL